MPRSTKTSQAKSQATPITAAPAEQQKKSLPVIPKSIDLITDAVSEMLTTGTSEDALESLLLATIEHTTRRTYERGIGCDDQSVIREGIDREVKRHYQNWKQDIIAAWRHHRRESPAAIEPATITERIRLNARKELGERFEGFLGSAMPEDTRFMVEVMRTWESQSCINPMLGTGEIHIGAAFETELGRRDVSFITVPGRMAARVAAYVDALRAVEDKAA